MSFWPRKTTFTDVLINSLWAFIAGIIGSLIIVVILFFSYNFISIDVVTTFDNANKLWVQISPMFPLFLSIITLIGTSITMFLTYFLLVVTSGGKYKKNVIILWQFGFFALISYLFITPVYVFTWIVESNNIMYVFLVHCLLVAFGTWIIMDILNNYRHILTDLYGSFIWLFISIIVTIIVFFSLPTGFAKLVSLLALLPLINFLSIFFKWLFEYLYYHYNRYTNLDPLWDIFYQIELEENELLREEEEKNNI